MIDLHSHIIPNIDDGSKSYDMTVNMLKQAEADGTNIIFATPHFKKFYYETRYSDILKKVDEINLICEGENIDVEVISGQEILLDEYTLKEFDEGNLGTLNNTKYMLVEFPMDKLGNDNLDTVYELRVQGIIPIIAHPERYAYVENNIASLNCFIKEGCLFQINTGSITGTYGVKVQKTVFNLLNNGICHFIGSDAHSDDRRKPGLTSALNYIENMDKWLLNEIELNSNLLVQGKDIFSQVELVEEKRKKRFGIF
ncbi:tyrosine-protein phosphatase [Clostridium sp. DL1XJH146]